MRTIFLVLLILELILSEKTNSDCEKIIKLNSSDSDIITEINRNFELIKLDKMYLIWILFRCIELLLRQGFHSALEYFLSLLLKNKINYKDNLNSAISKISYELDEIQHKFRFVGGDVIK